MFRRKKQFLEKNWQAVNKVSVKVLSSLLVFGIKIVQVFFKSTNQRIGFWSKVTKLFTSVIYKCSLQVRMLVPSRPAKPSLMFLVRQGAYPGVEHMKDASSFFKSITQWIMNRVFAHCCNTFYVRNLQVFVLSQSVCPRQVASA